MMGGLLLIAGLVIAFIQTAAHPHVAQARSTLGTISGGVLIIGLLMIIAAILSAAVGRRRHRRGEPPKPMER